MRKYFIIFGKVKLIKIQNYSKNTLVVATHGFIKKTSRVPEIEIKKAKQLRIKYFEDKVKSIGK